MQFADVPRCRRPPSPATNRLRERKISTIAPDYCSRDPDGGKRPVQAGDGQTIFGEGRAR